jgi:hypothetical protein
MLEHSKLKVFHQQVSQDHLKRNIKEEMRLGL